MNCLQSRSLGIIFPFYLMISETYASGFAVKEQSALLQGTSYAGATSGYGNASFLFFNPASTSFTGNALNADFSGIFPISRSSNQSASNALGTGIETNGSQKEFFDVAMIPSVSISKKINHDFSLGVTLNAPFGFSNHYDKGWRGRYHAVDSELKTISVNPIIAYKPIENLSIAAGPVVQYAKAKLSQAVNNNILYAFTANRVQSLGGTPSLQSIGSDGFASVSGSDWGYGWTAGLLYRMTSRTDLGISYRSKITHKLEGKSYYSNIDPYSAVVNKLQNGSISAQFSSPAIINLGASHRLNDHFKIMADISLTQWSSFKEIRIRNNNGATDSVTKQDWDNSLFYALGSEYAYNDAVTLRTGIAVDETPTDTSHRTPRIPDSRRYWASLGLGYKLNDHLSFDIGYSHLWLDNAKVNLSATPFNENNTRGNFSAEYDNNIHILMASTSWNF